MQSAYIIIGYHPPQLFEALPCATARVTPTVPEPMPRQQRFIRIHALDGKRSGTCAHVRARACAKVCVRARSGTGNTVAKVRMRASHWEEQGKVENRLSCESELMGPIWLWPI